MSKKLVFFIAALLVLHFALTMYCIIANSPTCDEIAHHVASGYSYIKTGDFRMNPANPPLIREISAIPLLFLNPTLPLDSVSWKDGNSPLFGKEFFYKVNKNSDTMIFLARIPIALLSVILALLIFLWSKALYGIRGGLLSLILYCFCPNIMAFAGLATVDFGTTFFIFTALFSFWLYVNKPSMKNLILAGICFGLAQASKYTSIFLIPIFILIAFAIYYVTDKRERMPVLKKLGFPVLIIFLIGFFVLYATYFFEWKPLLKNVPNIPQKIEYIKKFVENHQLAKIGLTKEAAVNFAQNVSMPFSKYIVGLLGVIHQSSAGMNTYLLGKYSSTGSWSYFSIAFLTKTELPTLFLLFACIVILLRKANKKNIINGLFLLIPALLFFIIISRSRVQVGVRHILQIYPLIFVFIGSFNLIDIKQKFKDVFLGCILIMQLASLAVSYPYPIAYFNEIAGGPDKGYKILRDSNLDWGQGLKALGAYTKDNNIKEIKLLYFGTADPLYYRIPYVGLKQAELEKPEKSFYAISAQYLDSVKWTKDHEPLVKIAHSIFVYKF